MKKICICTTMSSSIDNWIVPFLNEYNKRNVDVSIVCNMTKEYEKTFKEKFPFVTTYPINFPRGIDLFGTIKSIAQLVKLFKKNKFDLVQYSTPNASMYGAVASKLTNVPVRLYCQWGMVYITMTGIKRHVFEKIERLVCKLSTEIQPDSKGNLDFCRLNKMYDDSKSRVIWNGSAKGLDLNAFDVTYKEQYSKEIKQKYKILDEEIVLGFVGRLGREKGCNELFRSFKNIKKKYPNVKLLFIGPIEKEETIEKELLEYFWNCEDIIKTDRVNNVEKYISAMDIFILPSYREGFGMSVIEASAMQVAVIVTKYPGPSSAICEGVSGYSIPIKDDVILTNCIIELLNNPSLTKKMGIDGRKFVESHFDQTIFIEKYMENRMELLKTEGE